MYFAPNTLAANARLQGHWQELWANRNIWNIHNAGMIQQYQAAMTAEQLACNALAGLQGEFWAEIDREILQLRDQTTGMEIITDLLGVQTVLPVGKTAKLYNIVGDIADDVSVSLDGQAPYSFDHTDYANDGDPIPMFTAGFGVNWRHAQGLNTVGIDLVLDSQRAKMRQYNKKIVSYFLDGDSRIQVDSYPAQGMRNHRRTKKINLGTDVGGVNIDLTTADPAELMAFFGAAGPFGMAARENQVDAYDVTWVSHEIWANMSRPYLIELNAGSNAAISGTVMQAVMPFAATRSFRPTYALSGNEFISYVRRRDIISPLVGMATGVVPLPRPMPQSNYNFQIMSAAGLQITNDAEGRGGVLYGADLDA